MSEQQYSAAVASMIRAAAQRENLSIRALARQAGVSKSAVQRALAGTLPQAYTLALICDRLGVVLPKPKKS